jgi:bifunctional N-acetylglucosamine-1-phosphate-uridyltransferase/glucosamine-1-phosphate-acetyltransferase GlmU-like protein
MRTADGQRQLEKKFEFPHSNMKQVFGSVRFSLVKWAERQIKAGTITEIRGIAKEHCKYNEFKDCTLIIDSADFPLVKQDGLKKKSQHHSYKENRHATRIQFITDQSRIVRHDSGPFLRKNYDA